MGNDMENIQCPHCLSLNPEDSQYCSRCGSSLEKKEETISYAPDQEQLTKDRIHYSPGENFGRRYTIIEEVGRGGMGRVYKAEDNELGTTVALKVIKPKYSRDKRFIEGFKKETLLARSISHENVIRIHDIGEVEGTKYISMDYIKGQSLRDLIHSSGKLTVETAFKITFDICEALKAAHKKGIVHRDLKPQNIMIDKNGKAYIMDFGLAKAAQVQDVSAPGVIVGTPQYISPEQARGEKADQSSDIYALGTILYEMLTGKPVFEAKTTQGYFTKHLYEKPEDPSKLNPRIPQSLEKVILKCLEKDRSKRYQNTDDLLKYLNEIEQNAMPSPVSKWIKKYQKPIVAISILTIVILIFLVWKLSKEEVIASPGEDSRIAVAVMTFRNNTGDVKLENWRSALQDILMTDLAQSKYLRVLTIDRLSEILMSLNQMDTEHYSSEVLDRIAKEEDIDYFILGGYTKSGGAFRITAQLIAAYASEFLDATMVQGLGEESFHQLIDQLTPWVKSKLNLSSIEIANDIDREIGKITTKSPEALDYFLQGERYFREKKYQESIASLEKAVAIDSEFASAYGLIGTNYSYMRRTEETKKYLEKAMALADRVSDRERYLIQGIYYITVDESYIKAIESYEEVLNIYTDDEDAMLKLGALYLNLEEWDQALVWYNKVLETKRRSENVCTNVAYMFMATGRYDQARNILESNKDLLSSEVYYHRNICHTYLYEGNYEAAFKEAEKAKSLDPGDYRNDELIGILYHLNDQFREAEGTYRKLLKTDVPEAQSNGRLRLSQLHLIKGEYKRCLDEINSGISIAQEFNLKEDEANFQLFLAYTYYQLHKPDEALVAIEKALDISVEFKFMNLQKSALHLKGLICLEKNMMEQATKLSAELKGLIEGTENKKHLRYYHNLLGWIDLENEEIQRAINRFNASIMLLPSQAYLLGDQAFYLYSAASAYRNAGDLENAKANYERITSLTYGKLQYGDIYAKSFYGLGKICQNQGLNDRAVEYFTKFLNLWKDSDAEIAEVDDATIQLSILN
jgi:serine/threonine protein kinase/Flp pilus assembly protein TadD